MSKDHVLDELSAYIDGEAADADGIGRHLQHCESCARRHMQLLKLSSHLQVLEGPKLRPEFLTRVMTGVREEPARGHRWMPALIAGTAFAAVALVVGALWAVRPPVEPAGNLARVVRWENDDAVVEAFEALIEQDSDLSLIEGDVEMLALAGAPVSEGEAAGADALALDTVVDYLAEDLLEEAGEEDVHGDGDLFTAIGALDEEEEAALQELLGDYLESVNQRG